MTNELKTEKMNFGIICGWPSLKVDVPAGLSNRINEIERLTKRGEIKKARKLIDQGFPLRMA